MDIQKRSVLMYLCTCTYVSLSTGPSLHVLIGLREQGTVQLHGVTNLGIYESRWRGPTCFRDDCNLS